MSLARCTGRGFSRCKGMEVGVGERVGALASEASKGLENEAQFFSG